STAESIMLKPKPASAPHLARGRMAKSREDVILTDFDHASFSLVWAPFLRALAQARRKARRIWPTTGAKNGANWRFFEAPKRHFGVLEPTANRSDPSKLVLFTPAEHSCLNPPPKRHFGEEAPLDEAASPRDGEIVWVGTAHPRGKPRSDRSPVIPLGFRPCGR